MTTIVIIASIVSLVSASLAAGGAVFTFFCLRGMREAAARADHNADETARAAGRVAGAMREIQERIPSWPPSPKTE